MKLDPLTGAAEELRLLDTSVAAFILATEQLLTGSGDLIDLASGEVAARLEFSGGS